MCHRVPCTQQQAAAAFSPGQNLVEHAPKTHVPVRAALLDAARRPISPYATVSALPGCWSRLRQAMARKLRLQGALLPTPPALKHL